jgi:hypothetical protein
VSVEVSNLLRLGRPVTFLVEQNGLLGLKRVQVFLVCTESVSSIGGEMMAMATRDVVRMEVGASVPGLAGEGLRGTFTVPAEAMHSFKTSHNKIAWELRVSGWAGGLLPHESCCPVIIRPVGEEEEGERA